MNFKDSFKIIEDTYEKTTEEYKSMRWLKEKIEDDNDSCLNIHYEIILYYLVINLLKENKQLEQHIRDINQMVKDDCWYPDVGYANMTSIEVMELVQLLNKINIGNKLYWDDDLQNLYNELTKERK